MNAYPTELGEKKVNIVKVRKLLSLIINSLLLNMAILTLSKLMHTFVWIKTVCTVRIKNDL